MDAAIRREALPGDHVWWRIADPAWSNPLDPDFAWRRGGRWNPPDSFPVLYLNEDRTWLSPLGLRWRQHSTQSFEPGTTVAN